MHQCTKCKNYGLQFNRTHSPVDFIAGKKNSRIWIIGLNPAEESSDAIPKTTQELENYFDDTKQIHSYFKKFNSVSKIVFGGWGKNLGTAHTDLVKCSSKSFPPKSATGKKEVENIVNNCKEFLVTQIKTHKPKIIVCNGIEVSKFMLKFLPPPTTYTKEQTSYLTVIDGTDVCVVLSGFIGRLDNYAKRRLGIEIEEQLNRIA